MQRKTIANGLCGMGIKCKYHGDKSVWLGKQPLNSIHKKPQVGKNLAFR
jgi:hypothetical protein